MKKTAIVLCSLAVACASTQPVPKELAAARDAYKQAASSRGASLVMADIHKAEVALQVAEKAYKDDRENPKAADTAYLAQRRAELAEALGAGALAQQEEAEGEKAITEAHANASQQKEAELKKAKEELVKAQQQTQEALSQLSNLKDSVKQESRGLVITLSGNVLFASNQAKLLTSAKKQLGDIAHALAGAKGQNIVIEGYTDATGKKERNEELSQQRAEAVMNYLVDQGLPREHIRAVGRGPENPIADNKSAEGRATNRRVEIVVQGEVTTG